MAEAGKFSGTYVFGLDIGTRSIVGTVGFQKNDQFIIMAQRSKEHETRAMLDGQIHDIGRVSDAIKQVKEKLEKDLQITLSDVCIAAAGRVLRTKNIHIEYEMEGERTITNEDISNLHSLGIEKAYEEFNKENDTDTKFYCVGYSVIKYFLNHYPISNLENHKAKSMAADMIATFLPDEVVDGLYKAVELAGLNVANMTLEPIAAIQVAIPEMYRMLNIALVDVGAGTSDISITKDGSISAYGMIPIAGDSLTEVIARHCLVDFTTAEQIKKDCLCNDIIEYKDIMSLTQTIKKEQIVAMLTPAITEMTKQVAEKMKELNGGKSVSAVFVVGGGGIIDGYTDLLAKELEIAPERVALRGEEVMQKIVFMEEDVIKDSLLVTPIGICLSYYEQSNNFIFVTINQQKIKLYDNSKLAVVDAAMQINFPNDKLFPKRGQELDFIVNGKHRIVRGLPGEAAIITVNGIPGDIHTKIKANDTIEIIESTAGDAAYMEIQNLPEYQSTIEVLINNNKVQLPKFASVNGELKSGYYSICQQDSINMLNEYTVEQIANFIDIEINSQLVVMVNNQRATLNTKVYENFSVTFSNENQSKTKELKKTFEKSFGKFEDEIEEEIEEIEEDLEEDLQQDFDDDFEQYDDTKNNKENVKETVFNKKRDANKRFEEAKMKEEIISLSVIVNKKPITLKGKSKYIFVDIFDYIDFDLSTPKGKNIVTNLNGMKAQYMNSINSGDVIEIYWE